MPNFSRRTAHYFACVLYDSYSGEVRTLLSECTRNDSSTKRTVKEIMMQIVNYWTDSVYQDSVGSVQNGK